MTRKGEKPVQLFDETLLIRLGLLSFRQDLWQSLSRPSPGGMPQFSNEVMHNVEIQLRWQLRSIFY